MPGILAKTSRMTHNAFAEEDMRILICCVIAVAVVLFTGCANQEAEPTPETPNAPEAAVDPEPIATEDFETGEAEGAVEEGDEQPEEPPSH